MAGQAPARGQRTRTGGCEARAPALLARMHPIGSLASALRFTTLKDASTQLILYFAQAPPSLGHAPAGRYQTGTSLASQHMCESVISRVSSGRCASTDDHGKQRRPRPEPRWGACRPDLYLP